VLALVAALLGAACSRDATVQQTIADTDALTQTITQAVLDAPDKRQGVASARAALNATRATLQPALLELKSLRAYQVSAPLSARWRDALIDDMAAVEDLRRVLRSETAADPQLDAELNALIADFEAMLAARPAT